MMPRRLLLILSSAVLALPGAALAQSNASTDVNNSVSPSSTVNQVTGGGVNLNQQYNNQWDNQNGFAPGVFCRTPTFYVGGGTNQANVWGGSLGTSANDTSVQAGLLVPFGSSVLADCKRLAKALTDRAEISNQASLAKTCHELKTLGVTIDPARFPALAVCLPADTASKPL